MKSHNIRLAAVVHYKTEILNPDGSLARSRDWKRNLVLDSGLDQIAGQNLANLTRYCAIGTGSTPTKRDSGTVTFSQTGGVITASAGFFESADAGRLLKWDTGEEVRIVNFVDASTVGCAPTTPDIAAAEGTVWYTNETGHGNESARTSTCDGGAAQNVTTLTGATLQHQRRYLFPAFGSARTITEIGWAPGATGSLFGRDLVPGGDFLDAGQQYRVTSRLQIDLSPDSPTAAASVGTGGWDTTGTAAWEYIGESISKVNADGTVSVPTSNKGIEPAMTKYIDRMTGTYTQTAGPALTYGYANGALNQACANSSYVNGTFTRSASITLSTSQGNGSWYGVTFGTTSNPNAQRAFSLKFDAPQVKDSDHTLTLTFSQSWGRTLVN